MWRGWGRTKAKTIKFIIEIGKQIDANTATDELWASLEYYSGDEEMMVDRLYSTLTTLSPNRSPQGTTQDDDVPWYQPHEATTDEAEDNLSMATEKQELSQKGSGIFAMVGGVSSTIAKVNSELWHMLGPQTAESTKDSNITTDN